MRRPPLFFSCHEVIYRAGRYIASVGHIASRKGLFCDISLTRCDIFAHRKCDIMLTHCDMRFAREKPHPSAAPTPSPIGEGKNFLFFSCVSALFFDLYGESRLLRTNEGDSLHDKEIIDLYFDRDQSAVTESERKYGALCLSVSMRILNNKQDAEECVADTWLAAWNCIPPQRPAKLGAFFSRIVRNISVDRLRSQTTAKRGGGEAALLLSELDECLTGQSAEDSYMEKETVAAINAFLKKLPKKERDFFVLRYYHAYSVKEISEMTGFAENNVRAALSSARKKLKDFLVKRGLL